MAPPQALFGASEPKVAAATGGGLLAAGFRGDIALLAKFDQEGTSAWGEGGKGISLDGLMSIACLEPSEDGGCFLAGAWSGKGATRPEDQVFFLARFDGHGNPLWRAYGQLGLRFGVEGEFQARCLMPLPGDACVLLGTAHEREGDRGWLLRLRPDGSPVWRKDGKEGLLFADEGGERLFKAAVLRNGGMILLGQAGTAPAGLVGQPDGQAPQPPASSASLNLVPPVGDAWLLLLDRQGNSLLNTFGHGSGLRITGTHFSDVAVDAKDHVWIAGSAWMSQNDGSAGFLLLLTDEGLSVPSSFDGRWQWNQGVNGGLLIPTDHGGGFTQAIPTAEGGCLLVGRAGPVNAPRTWFVKLDERAIAVWRTGELIGHFLPDDGAAPPVLFTRAGSDAWLLSPRSVDVTRPFRMLRLKASGDLAWICDPVDPGASVTLAPPQDQRGDFLVQGIAQGAPWLLRLDASGRQTGAPHP